MQATDQVNLTDPDSRVMPVRGKGFEQSYNAQAAVDTESMLVVATTLTQAPTNKQQVSRGRLPWNRPFLIDTALVA